MENQQQPPGRRSRRRPPKPKQTDAPSARPVSSAPSASGGKTAPLMVVNVAEEGECRIAILVNKRLEELYIERASAASHVGNIYKGRVTNVEPSIQAAFVDFGHVRNGFLHISDLQPQYFPGGRNEPEDVGRKTPRRDRPLIQDCLRRGSEVIVQITKEGIGTKGPTLTTYVSVPGRYLVMMPGMNRLGVSRKIEDDAARRSMRDTLAQLTLPKGMGFILRTAGLDRTKRELQRDLQYLQRLWKAVSTRIKNERAPAELYQESDLVIRTIRDVWTTDFERIVVDNEEVAQKARDFISLVSPRRANVVDLYEGNAPIFHHYGIEAEIERLHSRHVPLQSGGSLVIDSTEALVAIDVNSGKYRETRDAEESAHKINLEAADEVARQLRLRDLGGLIIIDFIDMIAERNRRDVERALREALRKHKERAKVLRMSQFGIIELTRQRQRPSIKRSVYQDCPCCKGSGLVKTPESMTLDLMRVLRLAVHHDSVSRIVVDAHPSVAFEVLNRKRQVITQLETASGKRISISGVSEMALDEYRITCYDKLDRPVEAPGGPALVRAPSAPPLPPPARSAASEGAGGDGSAPGSRRRRRGGRRRGRRRSNGDGNGAPRDQTSAPVNGGMEPPEPTPADAVPEPPAILTD